MDTKTFPITFLSEISISAIGIIQLIQALSFIKDAPESGSWNSSASNFFSFCKDLALRFDGDAFIAIYIASCVVSFISIIVYIIFFDQIHKANKQNGAFFYLILFFEYGVFGFGFIPMISKFAQAICLRSFSASIGERYRQFGKSLVGYRHDNSPLRDFRPIF